MSITEVSNTLSSDTFPSFRPSSFVYCSTDSSSLMLPLPTHEKKKIIIEEIFNSLVKNTTPEVLQKGWIEFTRTGGRTVRYLFNGKLKSNPELFKGFTFTQDFLNDIVSQLGRYFPEVILDDVTHQGKPITLPSDTSTLVSLKLKLYPEREMPELSPDATDVERALYEYVQSAIRYYREDRASKEAVDYILNELNPRALLRGEVLCLVRKFRFNTDDAESEALKNLSICHQIPKIKSILERTLGEYGITHLITTEAEGDGYHEGHIEVRITDAKEAAIFSFDNHNRDDGRFAILFKKAHEGVIESLRSTDECTREAKELADHFKQIANLKKLAETRDPGDPLVRLINNLRSEW